MTITNIFKTDSELALKGLMLNEDRTVIIGKVQDKHNKLNKISTKWKIDRVKMMAICVLEDKDYDFSIEGKHIPGVEPVKIAKSFYTFKKDAWHCKLYKWVYGKEPHKVHPTMCPYFWIMVLTMLIFPLVLIVKLFGKAGTNFMESLTTYKQRQREKAKIREENKRDKWIQYILDNYDKFTPDDAYKVFKSRMWDDYSSIIMWDYDNIFQTIKEKKVTYYDNIRIKEVERQQVQWLKQQARDEIRIQREKEYLAKNPPKPKADKKEKPQINYRETKIAKIIGIMLIAISIATLGYFLCICLIRFFNWINWFYVGMSILCIIGAVIAGFITYYGAIYIIIPFVNYILVPLLRAGYKVLCYICDKLLWFYEKCITPFFKWTVVKPLDFCVAKPFMGGVEYVSDIKVNTKKIDNFFDGVLKVFVFCFGWIPWIFVQMYYGGVNTINFFKMCKDLIYQMYKKNCPIITWTDEENNLKNK